jgi:type II secretory ATPase GspE/PulE/Tfp pilus assembly ATPase PilB-like protein
MEQQSEAVPFMEVAFELRPDALEESFAGLVHHALHMPASDLFVSFDESDAAISVRHLGLVRPLTRVTHEMGRRIINLIKSNSGMDLAQRYRPLDGRWVCSLPDGEKVDLRVNTIPTMYGEDLCARLLRRSAELVELENLGLHRHGLGELKGMLGSPSGLILVTGPTGVGKTTTLYACIKRLHDGTRKINTIEDPIEYAVPGLRQSAVRPQIALDFPELLRSVLRQAPDVIMIGEIRDPITAETAVRAANSGHLVLSTLHAPIAAAAVDSMLALGVHPHFLGTSLLGIVTQRLLRTLCPKCRVSWDISEAPHTFDDVRNWLSPGQGQSIYSAPGCDQCYREGYTGQTGVFEVLPVAKEIRQLINQRASALRIRDKAVEQGMIDIRRAALLKVADGTTSIEELVRAVPAEHLQPDD